MYKQTGFSIIIHPSAKSVGKKWTVKKDRAKRISSAQTCREHKKHTHTHIGSKHNHLTFIGLKQILLWDVINLTQNTSFGNCIVQNQFAFTKELVLTELLGLNKHERSLIWFSSIEALGTLGTPVWCLIWGCQFNCLIHYMFLQGDILPT